MDAGDALAGSADYERIQYGYIQQAFGKLGYDALNIGHREARLSAAQLREVKARSPVALLSANLLDKTTGAPLFSRLGPRTIFECSTHTASSPSVK